MSDGYYDVKEIAAILFPSRMVNTELAESSISMILGLLGAFTIAISDLFI